MEVDKCVQVGLLDTDGFEQNNRVYSENFCSQGWRAKEQCFKVLIKQATQAGYIESEIPAVIDLSYPSSSTRRGRVQENGKISPTITANYELDVIEPAEEIQYRIRKLTPKECWRLMAFTDNDFNKAQTVNSNTQLYKQAGNSIVVNVLEELFKSIM